MAESTAPDRIPLTIEVTPAQKRRLEQSAEEKGGSPEAVVLAVLDRELEAAPSNGDDERDSSPSLLEATRDLAGSVEADDAPADLSSNPEQMTGYGQ
jgi:hypothetical protein